MDSEKDTHTLLQIGYYASFGLAITGSIVTLILGLYGVRDALTQRIEVLQWDGSILFMLLAGIPSFFLSLLNFKYESVLKQLGAEGSWLLSHSKKILVTLIVLASICYAIDTAISIIRLDFIH